jgi:hypothetical protein
MDKKHSRSAEVILPEPPLTEDTIPAHQLRVEKELRKLMQAKLLPFAPSEKTKTRKTTVKY